MHINTMLLSVERKAIHLPHGYCDAEGVRRCVKRISPPITVHAQFGNNKFSIPRRVHFSVDGLSVECESEGELRLACKLVALDHNRWQTNDDENLQQIISETARMEAEAKARMEAPLEEADFLPEELVTEEEDVTIDEWSQLGYKWFKKEEVVYL
jgi:hypothetical protein